MILSLRLPGVAEAAIAEPLASFRCLIDGPHACFRAVMLSALVFRQRLSNWGHELTQGSSR